MNEKTQAVVDLIVFVCFVVVIIMLIISCFYPQPEECDMLLETAYEDDYEFYYNGIPVDKDNIDVDLYEYTVDVDNEKVFLADKAGSNKTVWWPFIIYR